MAEPTYPDGSPGLPHRPAVASSGSLAQTDGRLAYLRVNPTTGALKTEVTGAGSGGTSSVDGDAFTVGASAGTAIIGEVGGTSLKIAVLNSSRDQIVQLARGSDGAEIGTVGTPVRNQQVGTSQVQIVDGSANAVTVTGNKLDVNASVTISSVAATGGAVPASANYGGINVGGNIVGQTGVNPSGSIEAGNVDVASIAGTTAATNSGTKTAGTLRVVIATDQPALTNKLLVTPDALPANQSCNVAQINGVTPLMGAGNTGTGSPRVTIATDQAVIPVAGPTASGSSLTANPLTVGGLAKTALPTAVSDAQVVNAMLDKYGRQIVIPQAPRDLIATQTTTIAASTAETTVVTAAASIFADMALITVANTSATATRVDFRDTTGGSVIFSLYCPAGVTTGFVPQVPVPQSSVNTNWTATCITSLTDLRIFAQWVKNR